MTTSANKVHARLLERLEGRREFYANTAEKHHDKEAREQMALRRDCLDLVLSDVRAILKDDE